MSARDVPAKSCPICRKPADERFRPFCSKRCADVDLHRWLAGVYAVPAVESDEEPKESGETGRSSVGRSSGQGGGDPL